MPQNLVCKIKRMELILNKPKIAQKKAIYSRKRKREDGKTAEIKVHARINPNSEHFVESLNDRMGSLSCNE
jgi:hypothetical protein